MVRVKNLSRQKIIRLAIESFVIYAASIFLFLTSSLVEPPKKD